MSGKRIAGHELLSGKKMSGMFPVPGTELQIPYNIICGESQGKTVLITAGIHSAEFVGIQAAIELAEELKPENIRGTVVILPLVNRSGFEHRTMSMVYEDGKNLNRVFPGNPEGSTAEKLAYTVFREFILHSDAHIDLHCGDGYEELVPFAYYLGDTLVEETARQMIACVQTKLCVRSRCRTGGAYNLAAMNGIPSVLIERGQLSQFSRDEVDADKADVCNILRRLGILPGVWQEHSKMELYEYLETAPVTGCWYPEKHVGDVFRTGEKLGEIRDYFGRALYMFFAPEDGILLYQCYSLNILKDGPMISYGVPVKP